MLECSLTKLMNQGWSFLPSQLLIPRKKNLDEWLPEIGVHELKTEALWQMARWWRDEIWLNEHLETWTINKSIQNSARYFKSDLWIGTCGGEESSPIQLGTYEWLTNWMNWTELNCEFQFNWNRNDTARLCGLWRNLEQTLFSRNRTTYNICGHLNDGKMGQIMKISKEIFFLYNINTPKYWS